jgi:uncharacterized cupredoxin-like copper-binding protein
MNEEETRAYHEEEEQYERSLEARYEGVYEFMSNNKEDLYDDFIIENQKEFNEMLKQEIIDEDRDIDYWKEVFCREEKEQEFLDYCEEEYNNGKE